MKQNSSTQVEPIMSSHTFGNTPVMGSTVFNEDCMAVMVRYPDKFFDLAIVDPPYGISIAKNGKLKANSKFDRGFYKDVDYGAKEWDANTPNAEYWKELFRVSKNQIVWGGNFFLEYLGNARCYITWYKKGKDKNHRFSPTEWAWTSYLKTPTFYDIDWIGFGYINSGETKIHPTQKPVKLYESILFDFAEVGNKILDTHVGSGSSRIACHKNGFEFVGCEIDAEYFAAQETRFKEFTSQLRLFG